MITNPTATSARVAVISLTCSGVRAESCLSDCHAAGDRVGRAMPGGRLRGGEAHYVADAAQGVQQVRLGRVDLAAQDGDVRLDDAGVAAEVVVPYVVEYLHLGQHPAGVAHEVPEQLELGGRQLHLRTVAPHLVAVLVELEVGERQPGRRLDRAALG